MIGGREIGTGDLVFLRRIGFCRCRSDYNSMVTTFGRHIDNTIKRTWKSDPIWLVRNGRKKSLYVFTPLVLRHKR
jgi:hypothetical protein